ncbi:glycan biosynthesis hexose transferase WsfD [Comamonas odontotermitis]|uniref:glycan biosynthesis hexose transferase WsfD n=1 Tax=Comamonas odontotermitis TaxID=379895 RepID=UPI001CC45A13|nr:hypothetical protein [Comamonas odontotermitis]UBB16493.1 hypothetical protein LAD35_17050 [Comamonas odontotermitis]
MTSAQTPPSRRFRWLFFIGFFAAGVAGVALICGSQALLFVDTNDFQRVVGHLYLTPLGDGIRWALPERPFRMPGNPELASHIFTFAGWVQRYLPGAVFDISRTALAAKLLLLAYAGALAWQCAAALQRGAVWCTVFALGWLAVFFMAHNIGMAQSFYAEYACLVALPLLLVGMLASRRTVRILCLGLGALVCGLAKVQYFYLPLLALVCVWAASRWQRMVPDRALLKLLFAVQVVCLVPLLIGKNAGLNAYHGVYLGSYMVLTPAQLDDLGVPADRRACIGVDAWGNALSGPGGTQVQHTEHTCYSVTPKLGKADVLRPYLHHPQVLWRLAEYALPSHFTVQYFHVFPGSFYLRRVEGGASGVTDLLLRMTEVRERTITPLAPLFLLGSLLLFAASRSRHASGLRQLAAGSLLLGLFVVSQVIIVLLGEGVRDMSKHLWAAQLALDMLVLLTGLQCLGWLWVWRRRKAAGHAPEVSAPVLPGMLGTHQKSE